MAPRQKTGQQAKADSMTIRIAPKLKFGVDLLARLQHRNLSSVVEWAVQKLINDPSEGLIIRGDNNLQGFSLLDALWDPDESDRLYNIAQFAAGLLTFEEQRLCKLIRESDYFVAMNEELAKQNKQGDAYHNVMRPYLRKKYSIFKQVTEGTLPETNLPKPPKNLTVE